MIHAMRDARATASHGFVPIHFTTWHDPRRDTLPGTVTINMKTGVWCYGKWERTLQQPSRHSLWQRLGFVDIHGLDFVWVTREVPPLDLQVDVKWTDGKDDWVPAPGGRPWDCPQLNEVK